jgi:hypothetical protein
MRNGGSCVLEHSCTRSVRTQASTALRSVIVSPIAASGGIFPRADFVQISYVRQRINFGQIFDEAIRAIDAGARTRNTRTLA